ncbi:MAG: hypothetical protein WCJ58_05530 [bacterium]
MEKEGKEKHPVRKFAETILKVVGGVVVGSWLLGLFTGRKE